MLDHLLRDFKGGQKYSQRIKLYSKQKVLGGRPRRIKKKGEIVREIFCWEVHFKYFLCLHSFVKNLYL